MTKTKTKKHAAKSAIKIPPLNVEQAEAHRVHTEESESRRMAKLAKFSKAVNSRKKPAAAGKKAKQPIVSIHRHPNVAEIFYPGADVTPSSRLVAKDCGNYDEMLETVASGLKARGFEVTWRFFDANGLEGEKPDA